MKDDNILLEALKKIKGNPTFDINSRKVAFNAIEKYNQSPSDEKYEKELRLHRQLNAFSMAQEKGFEYACKLYPKDIDYLVASKDKSYNDVKAEMIKEMQSPLLNKEEIMTRIVYVEVKATEVPEDWYPKGYLNVGVGWLKPVSIPTYKDWVKVEDDLPSQGKIVITYHSTNDNMTTNHRYNNEWVEKVNGRNDDITHWLPLPNSPINPYKEQVLEVTNQDELFNELFVDYDKWMELPDNNFPRYIRKLKSQYSISKK